MKHNINSDKKCWQNIVAVHSSHDASLIHLKDGKINYFIEEERLTHYKHDEDPIHAMFDLKNYIKPNDGPYLHLFNCNTDYVDGVGLSNDLVEKEKFSMARSLTKISREYDFSFMDCRWEHHLYHAAGGFYNSGFDSAACLVIDGAGAVLDGKLLETESIFTCSYDKGFQKVYGTYISAKSEHFFNPPLSYKKYNLNSGFGMIYSAVSNFLGFGYLGSGKVMGLAPYGEDDPNIESFLDKNLKIRKDLYKKWDGDVFSGLHLKENSYLKYPEELDQIYKRGEYLWEKYNVLDYKPLVNLAYRCQKDFETYVINLIKKVIKITGQKNIVLSGGCALNCVANYEYLKYLPEGTRLYVEPICYDAGISYGSALYEWYRNSGSKEINPLKTLYLGPERKYDIPDGAYDVTPSDVIDIIEQRKLVAIFQGRSEQGPRALGNRSLLYDPRDPEGQKIVNLVKMREEFRPFAASVMLDHAHEWFDMRGMEETPFMMYAVDSYEHTWDTIPAVLHVDKTCRIQTVTREQNENYYNLIEEFYNRTGIPMLLNTSFNLGGDTICEFIQDAIDTLERSDIDYLYLPEHGKMVHIPRKY